MFTALAKRIQLPPETNPEGRMERIARIAADDLTALSKRLNDMIARGDALISLGEFVATGETDIKALDLPLRQAAHLLRTMGPDASEDLSRRVTATITRGLSELHGFAEEVVPRWWDAAAVARARGLADALREKYASVLHDDGKAPAEPWRLKYFDAKKIWEQAIENYRREHPKRKQRRRERERLARDRISQKIEKMTSDLHERWAEAGITQ